MRKNKLGAFNKALNKMRTQIRTEMGADLTLVQKKHYNILQMRSFLNKNATCRTINGEWI